MSIILLTPLLSDKNLNHKTGLEITSQLFCLGLYVRGRAESPTASRLRKCTMFFRMFAECRSSSRVTRQDGQTVTTRRWDARPKSGTTTVRRACCGHSWTGIHRDFLILFLALISFVPSYFCSCSYRCTYRPWLSWKCLSMVVLEYRWKWWVWCWVNSSTITPFVLSTFLPCRKQER